MDFKIEETGNTTTVKMAGPLTIEHATELSSCISNLPGGSEVFNVDLDEVTDIDLSCIQLLCSANSSFEKSRKRFILKSVQRKIITHALDEAG